jgi:ATP-dependent RNA helicase SUPV3L1/SUV3
MSENITDTGRYSLNPNGEIFWQENSTNPLPGKQVGCVEKGADILAPKAIANSDKSTEDLQSWLDNHVRDVLAPIFGLKEQDENALTEAAKNIGDALFDNMGVIHRSEIENFVPNLTPELRQPLRRKRVKMGPILIFLHDLMKPAAVNMRALLWALWNDKNLPMETPADGRVSITIDPESVDRYLYRSIGYPVFGDKAIRIDMLDRVVTDIYDSAKDWQFQAKHQYAEWLGCNIEDLYAVLSSMGHIKIEVEADPVQESTGVKPVDVMDAKSSEDLENKEAEVKIDQVKPELAFFKLKKGKISTRPGQNRNQNKSFDKNSKKNDRSQAKKKPMKKQHSGVKTFSAKPKDSELVDNNPFAILQQLKKK